MNEPTMPRIMSVMQPKPRPREIFPASHPAMRAMTTQPHNPLGRAIQTPRVSNRALNSVADIHPPRESSFASRLVMRRSLSDGLLLRHAMERAEAEDEIPARYPYDFSAREKFGEGVESDPVVRIVERRDDDDFVGDVKIRVAGGEALAIEINWGGHGER